jgi:sRNA-binding protein
MAYKPNYGLQRADRNRAARARSEQKQRKREEKSAQRKANVRLRLKAHLTMIRHNEGRSMNVAESKGLKRGSRVYWRGDATDGGIITEVSWDAVTIAWDNGQVATVHHGDMREIQRAPAKPTIV